MSLVAVFDVPVVIYETSGLTVRCYGYCSRRGPGDWDCRPMRLPADARVRIGSAAGTRRELL